MDETAEQLRTINQTGTHPGGEGVTKDLVKRKLIAPKSVPSSSTLPCRYPEEVLIHQKTHSLLGDERTQLLNRGQTARNGSYSGDATIVSPIAPNLLIFLLLPVIGSLADINSGAWKESSFKQYNFASAGQPPEGGALHPLLKMREEMRQIFFDMGSVFSLLHHTSPAWPSDVQVQNTDHDVDSQRCRRTDLWNRLSGISIRCLFLNNIQLERFRTLST